MAKLRHGSIGRLRARGPIVKVGKTWFVVGYDSATRVLRSPLLEVKRPPRPMDSNQIANESSRLLTLNEPDHSRLRRLFAPSFSNRSLDRLAPIITEKADEILDRACLLPSIDMASEFALPIASCGIGHVLGVPEGDRDYLSNLALLVGDGIDRTTSCDKRRLVQDADHDLTSYFDDLIWKADELPSPLVSGLVAASDAGRASRQEINSNCALLMIGGVLTTATYISEIVQYLAADPSGLRIFSDVSPACDVILDDILRKTSPVKSGVARVAIQDLVVEGQQIQYGDEVVVLFEAVNLDPFKDKANEVSHLAFGAGAHFCLGANMARIEARCAAQSLARSITRIDLLEPPKFGGSAAVNHIVSLPSRLTFR